jgi:GntR family transcriptional regulator, transcriptional repressor for pyruvate dehydrogenase complex
LTFWQEVGLSQLRRQSAPSPFVPSPIKGPAQQVRLAILEGITSGRLRSGDRLPSELEQAQGFKVSRAVIREALRSLAQLGLITTVQGRGGGSFVNHLEHGPVQHHLQEAMGLLLDFDEINLAELVDARRALEGTAARLGATRRGEEELAAMAEAIERSRNDTLATDAWLELDIHFHRAVVASAHNRVLSLPFAALHGVVQPRLNQLIMPLLDRQRVVAQHDTIRAAISSGDPGAAEQAVIHHVQDLERLYRRAGLLGTSPPAHDATQAAETSRKGRPKPAARR